MNPKRTMRLGALSVSLVLAATACASPSSPSPSPTASAPTGATTAPSGTASVPSTPSDMAPASQQVLTYNLGGTPGTLDPGQGSDVTDLEVDRLVFETLLHPKADLSGVTAGAASSWDVSSDGLTWTFHLRPDAKWSDGTPVTAQDFVYAWQRLLDPRLAAPFAVPSFTSTIKGAEGYTSIDPKADPSAVAPFLAGLGISAPNATTFQVVLQRPTPYFQWLVTLPASAPIEKAAVDAGGSSKWWDSPTTLIGNGPFKVTEIVPNDHITLVPNPDYNGPQGQPYLQKITLNENTDANADYAAYQNGQEDIVDLPLADTGLAKNDPTVKAQLVREPVLEMAWVQFNTKTPPFDNADVRMAFAKAINRDSLINDLRQGRSYAADYFIPKGMPGYDASLGAPLAYDPTAAKQLLAQSGEPASVLDNIHLLVRNRTAVVQIDQFLANQIQVNLGITLKQDVLDSKTVSQRVNSGQYQLQGPAVWAAQYPDPQDFFDLFETGNKNQGTGYSNSQYDSLVQQADGLSNMTQRLSLYNQAQALLLKDAPIAPLYQGDSWQLVKPYVKGMVLTALDIRPGDQFLTKVYIAAH